MVFLSSLSENGEVYAWKSRWREVGGGGGGGGGGRWWWGVGWMVMKAGDGTVTSEAQFVKRK